MNIALIVDHDIEITNGASLHTKQFLKWLADKNHYVHVMFPSREKMGCSNYGRNIKCHPIPAFSVPSYKEYCVPLPPLACSLWLRKWNIDLIHAETINPTLLLLGFWIKWCTKAPLFNVITANIPYYVHILFPKDNFIKTSCLKSGQAMMNWISNNIEGTFVLSEGVRKSLTDDFLRINQKKVFSLNRPIDLLRFSDSHGGAEMIYSQPNSYVQTSIFWARLTLIASPVFSKRQNTSFIALYPRHLAMSFVRRNSHGYQSQPLMIWQESDPKSRIQEQGYLLKIMMKKNSLPDSSNFMIIQNFVREYVKMHIEMLWLTIIPTKSIKI
jgi:glycosyltransferase involved in cell wall biosynthesis